MSDPSTPGSIMPIGSGGSSPPPSAYCFHVLAVWAPAPRSTASTPNVRASCTPHTCMLSPRTRSGNTRLLSSTATESPSWARANASEAPAMPPPTTATSIRPFNMNRPYVTPGLTGFHALVQPGLGLNSVIVGLPLITARPHPRLVAPAERPSPRYGAIRASRSRISSSNGSGSRPSL